MILIFPRLFVGDEDDGISLIWGHAGVAQNWSILHAAKEPFHRAFLKYETRAAPPGPEYLVARRGHRMALNFIDAENPKHIPAEMIRVGLDFITEELYNGRRVLVHCNQGQSRAPGIGLLWLRRFDPIYRDLDYDEAKIRFNDNYHGFTPGLAVDGFLKEHWNG